MASGALPISAAVHYEVPHLQLVLRTFTFANCNILVHPFAHHAIIAPPPPTLQLPHPVLLPTTSPFLPRVPRAQCRKHPGAKEKDPSDGVWGASWRNCLVENIGKRGGTLVPLVFFPPRFSSGATTASIDE